MQDFGYGWVHETVVFEIQSGVWKRKTEEEDTVMSDQKMYVYDCYNGDRGIIFAPTYDEAKLLFLQDYPERTIVSSFDDYYGYSDAAYLYKSDELKRNTLFKIFSA